MKNIRITRQGPFIIAGLCGYLAAEIDKVYNTFPFAVLSLCGAILLGGLVERCFEIEREYEK